MAIFSLRSAASFRNQSALLYKAAIHAGWEVDERDLSERAKFPRERWDRILVLAPLWPRYVFDSARLGAPWLSGSFWFYGPVDGPFTENINFFEVLKNTIRHERIAVPSQFCRDCLMRSGITPGKVVPHGIDPDDFKFDDSPKYDRLASLREAHPKKKIFFSNINPLHRKGFKHLAKAVRILAERRPNDFVFILHTGKGKALEYEKELDKTPNLVIEDAYNRLPFRQVTLKTRACDIFVHPSLLEGFGLTILEAMASRRPIVCADAPAMNELVTDKEAWLVPITQVKEERWELPGCMAQLHDYEPLSLARVMEYALDHPKESQEKADAAFERSKRYHYLRVYEPFMERGA